MADVKVTDLTALAAIPASGDFLMVVDVSDTTMSAAGTNKKIAASYFVNTSADKTFVTGDGTTGTLPVAGTVPVVSRANTFTATQAITLASGGTALVVTPAASAGNLNTVSLASFDNGTSTGPRIMIGINNNATTPAAGALALRNKSDTARILWQDDTGLIRIHTSAPTSATDTAGSVVGDQTSNAAFKDIVGVPVSDADALANIVSAADDVQRFTYKSGAYNGQEFSGIVLDGATLHRYGKDADEDYPAGKALNDVTLFGDLVLAIRGLAARVAALEA